MVMRLAMCFSNICYFDGALAVGRITYGQWIKFAWKLIVIWVLICAIAMSIALFVGY